MKRSTREKLRQAAGSRNRDRGGRFKAGPTAKTASLGALETSKPWEFDPAVDSRCQQKLRTVVSEPSARLAETWAYANTIAGDLGESGLEDSPDMHEEFSFFLEETTSDLEDLLAGAGYNLATSEDDDSEYWGNDSISSPNALFADTAWGGFDGDDPYFDVSFHAGVGSPDGWELTGWGSCTATLKSDGSWELEGL